MGFFDQFQEWIASARLRPKPALPGRAQQSWVIVIGNQNGDVASLLDGHPAEWPWWSNPNVRDGDPIFVYVNAKGAQDYNRGHRGDPIKPGFHIVARAIGGAYLNTELEGMWDQARDNPGHWVTISTAPGAAYRISPTITLDDLKSHPRLSSWQFTRTRGGSGVGTQISAEQHGDLVGLARAPSRALAQNQAFAELMRWQ